MNDTDKLIERLRGAATVLGAVEHPHSAQLLTDAIALLTKQQAEIERLTPAWIATSERLPTEADADHIGYVLVWNFEQAIEVRVHITEVLWPGTEWTHWQPIRRPEPPAGEGR